MSRNYMRVIVRNESNATLRLRHDWTSGEWTPGGWLPSQFPQTPPGAGLWWQAEGESVAGVPITGVEARAWYDVIDAAGAVVGELYIFANSPWVESQYGNTFHVRAPKGFYTAYADAKGQKVGDHSILEISFRNTKRVAVPGFLPSVNGFQFRNSWSENLPVVTLGALWSRFRKGIVDDVADFLGIGQMPEDWVPITKADAGLCGGMAFAAMDYFYANQLPPIARVGPDPDKGPGNFSLAPDSPDDPLFQFIRERLLDSFDFTGRGHRWLSYTSPIYPDDDEGVAQTLGLMKGKSWITYREEWPRIREQLDQGKLATIGLVQSSEFDIGANHQVLAYAYEQSGQMVRLWIYDSKIPGEARRWAQPLDADTVHLEFDITNTADGITVIRHNYPAEAPSRTKRIYAILYMDNYSQRTPPLGRALPPPGRPKVVRLSEADAKSTTTGGAVTSETANRCGEPMRKGAWTCMTTITFVAQVSGYMNPALTWKVNGSVVPAAPGPLRVDVAGSVYEVDAHINVGGRSLTLTSRSGDTYKVPVSVDVRDDLGETGHAETVFEVEGSYEGFRLEDIRAAAQCIFRTIPVPVDIYTIPKPGPLEAPVDLEQWAHVTLEKLRVDPSLDQSSRAALKGYISAQVRSPELRVSEPVRVNRASLRIFNR